MSRAVVQVAALLRRTLQRRYTGKIGRPYGAQAHLKTNRLPI